MKHEGLNMTQVKKKNRFSILNCICEIGPVSRKDIAEKTGLTPAAVTQICAGFMEQGLLFEIGQTTESQGVGRKKILVDINYDYAYILAVNIEQEQTTIALTNMKGNPEQIEVLSTRTGGSPKLLLMQIANVCRGILERKEMYQEKLAGVSVSIAGIVNKETGTSVHAYGIWQEEVPVCEVLSKELGCTVRIENNVNAFAMAELLYGMGKKHDNLLVIKWGPGVGSTIIIDNKVYEGRHAKAAELGHFIVERDGKLCNCGRRGCLETKVSYRVLAEKKNFLPKEFGDVYRTALRQGEEKIYEEAMDLFARTIVNSITILAPNRVVLCGSLFTDAKIRERLIEYCKKYDPQYDESRIYYSTLASQEDYIGAVAAFVQNEIF